MQSSMGTYIFALLIDFGLAGKHLNLKCKGPGEREKGGDREGRVWRVKVKIHYVHVQCVCMYRHT